MEKWRLMLIRFGVALLLGVVWQVVIGWEWGDFIGRSIVIALVVALTYPFERWIGRRNTTRAK